MAINPLNLKQKLSKAPQTKPQYPITVTSKSGKEYICGNPDISRALVALMDLSAVNGGAASHWGGPAAMAEAMSALHAIMFENESWFDHFNFINDIGHAENGIYALRANLVKAKCKSCVCSVYINVVKCCNTVNSCNGKCSTKSSTTA